MTGFAADPSAKLGDIAAEAGLEHIHILAWRDLDDPEAGGSELHAANIASRWAAAGIDVTMRTSFAPGLPQRVTRDGCKVIRKAGRYSVFPRAAASEMLGWHGKRSGLVEIWNGMPFFTPLWARGPRVTWLHHVHADMWQMTLPPRLARFGNAIESKIAPKLYRKTPIVTLCDSSKRELVDDLGFDDALVSVVPPGIDGRYFPAGPRSERPLVIAVGRLVPVKQFDRVIDIMVALKRKHPDLDAAIVGEGYCREECEARIAAADATDWLKLLGRVDDDALVDLYRRAWVLVSMSKREGWGMTLTEAAACGTPAVASRISGHEDALVDGETGVLVDTNDEAVSALDALLSDDLRLTVMSAAATRHAAHFTWERTARDTLVVLADAAHRRTDADQ